MSRFTRAALLLSLLAAGPAAGAGGLDPDARVDRRAVVAGVEIEDIAESDGGTLVRLVRRGRGYRFEYHLEFWRGNGGVVVGANFARGACRSGDSSMIQPREEAMKRLTLHARLSDYLRECPLPPAREAALRRALDSAWPVFSAWAEAALAAIDAENRAIADYGRP